jgi:arylsulfatase
MSKEADKVNETASSDRAIDRRNLLLGTSTLVAAATLTSSALAQAPKAAPGRS